MRQLSLVNELVIDLFAGGGGASTGIEKALGRSVDYAINHDPEAIAMHKANHPDTIHYQTSIFEVDPREVVQGRPVGLLWLSPDCKHFSKAKGGKPVDKKIRALCWVGLKWAYHVRPRVIMLENVEEFQTYGPLLPNGEPDPDKKGKSFLGFVNALRKLGYVVEWRELIAYEYGTPTSRKRLFMIARCDGQPIIWPKKTHGKPSDPRVQKGELIAWRTAAECIDWSIPCTSIFGRKKPLAEATMRRIARGVQKYVIEAKEPFIVTCNHGGEGFRGQSLNQPFKTVTAAHDAHGIVIPSMIQTGYGERKGQAPRALDIHAPLGTVVADGQKHALNCAHLMHFRDMPGAIPRNVSLDEPLNTVTAGGVCNALNVVSLMQNYGGNYKGAGKDVSEPVPTITTHDHNALICANLVRMFGTSNGAAADQPVGTITADGGGKTVLVESFLQIYNGNGGISPLDEPSNTVTTRDRLSLVTIMNLQWQITDILMRMLKPRELYRAQGFDDSYIIDPIYNGKRLSQKSQVRMCGNSVPPQFSEALVKANYSPLRITKRA